MRVSGGEGEGSGVRWEEGRKGRKGRVCRGREMKMEGGGREGRTVYVAGEKGKWKVEEGKEGQCWGLRKGNGKGRKKEGPCSGRLVINGMLLSIHSSRPNSWSAPITWEEGGERSGRWKAQKKG